MNVIISPVIEIKVICAQIMEHVNVDNAFAMQDGLVHLVIVDLQMKLVLHQELPMEYYVQDM